MKIFICDEAKVQDFRVLNILEVEIIDLKMLPEFLDELKSFFEVKLKEVKEKDDDNTNTNDTKQ